MISKPRAVFLSIVFAVLAIVPGTASATTNMECGGINSDAQVTILFGAGPLLAALEADVILGDEVISTREREGAEPAYILQFSANDRELLLELMDDQADQHLATIRLLRHLSDEDEGLQVGILRFKDAKPVGITCIGP